jgi:uncharacterized protein (TIGR00288 family)
MMAANRRLALLIDADNAQADLLPEMIDAVSKFGTITIRRIYGDWSEPNLVVWKALMQRYALHPEQQFSYVKGKNATDIALIIDAMDLLHTANVEGFCIVSSDSDYTPLVMRIREKGKFVLGVGRKQTVEGFVNACSEFVFTEDLQPTQPEAEKQPIADPKAKPKLEKLFKRAFKQSVLEEGWAHLGGFGSTLKTIDPDFDPRTYGHKQLSQLVDARQDFLEVRKQEGKGAIYVRLKTTR